MAETENQLYRTGRAWCIQHPVMDGVACGVAFFIVSSLLIGFALPAWAISIPITERIVINLGDLHPWVSIGVAIAVYLKMHKTEQHAAEAVTTAKDVATKIDGMLVDRDAGKVAEGEKKVHDEQSAAKDVASADAVRDAETKASITAIEAGPPGGMKN